MITLGFYEVYIYIISRNDERICEESGKAMVRILMSSHRREFTKL